MAGRAGAGYITATARRTPPDDRVRVVRCRRPAGAARACSRVAGDRDADRPRAGTPARASAARHVCGRPRQRRRAVRFSWMLLLR